MIGHTFTLIQIVDFDIASFATQPLRMYLSRIGLNACAARNPARSACLYTRLDTRYDFYAALFSLCALSQSPRAFESLPVAACGRHNRAHRKASPDQEALRQSARARLCFR